MVKTVWAGVEREVNCSEVELTEALAMDNPVMFGVWLGAVGEIGHAAGMALAKEYDEMLREEE